MTRCSWLPFMLHWLCPNFTSRLEIKCISLCSSNGCEYETLHSGCLLDTLFKHTPWPFFCLTYIARCSYFTKCRCDIDLRGVLVLQCVSNNLCLKFNKILTNDVVKFEQPALEWLKYWLYKGFVYTCNCLYEPCCEELVFGFSEQVRHKPSHRRWLEAWNFGFRK